MLLLQRALEPPTYGFERDGAFYVPSKREIFREFRSRMNIFDSRKNWISLWSWSAAFLLTIPFFIFVFKYFSLKLCLIGLAYSMIALGTHGTVYLHRFSTHRAYRFKNKFALFIVRNLVIKVLPEEIYVISHHVHHLLSEKAGDPYNVNGGWLYCFLADANHQPLRRNLNERDYQSFSRLMSHTGVRLNSFEQYETWGSICHPVNTFIHFALNWAFWFGVFFMIGGMPLATAIFGMSAVWAFGVRTFNYDGHGRGKDQRRVGIDFHSKDRSVNQVWPGYVSGEWHNNHHLYPNSARSGFLPYQLDLAWIFIYVYSLLGGITSYRDDKAVFFRDHYNPYLRSLKIPLKSELV